MSVHYKFKSALEYDTVTFDGLHISVKDLKKAIIHQKRIGKNTDFDLQVTNAQTKEVYTDESSLIPKNTSLVIARVPLAAQTKGKPWEGYGSQSGAVNTVGPLRPEDGVLSKAVDLTQLDASEDDKIRAMITQSTLDYDPSNYMKIRGSNQVGVVPAHYRCFKCHQPGHWIKDCPLGHGQEPMEIKKSTGIPRSFMVTVEGPMVPGAMMTPTGQYAVPVLDHQAYNESHKAAVPTKEEKPEIPEDLVCSICKDLLTDAVMIPCCGNSFCDECIRTVLLESEDHECPDCKEKDISPGTLIPNRFLRNSVSNFKNETGYHKRQQYRNAVVQPSQPALVQQQDHDIESVPEESVVQPVENTTIDAASVALKVDGKEELLLICDLEIANDNQKPIICESDLTDTKTLPVNEEHFEEKPIRVSSIVEGPPGVETSPLKEDKVTVSPDAPPPGVDSPPSKCILQLKQGQAITSVGSAVNHHRVSNHISPGNSTSRSVQNGEHATHSRHYPPPLVPLYSEPTTRSLEERPGTPTVDEPGIGPPGYSGPDTVNYTDTPPPGLHPTTTTLPPSQHMHPPPQIQGPPPSQPGTPAPGTYPVPPVATHQPPPGLYPNANGIAPSGYRMPPPGHPDFNRVVTNTSYGDGAHSLSRVLLVSNLDPTVPPPSVPPPQGPFGARPLYDPTRPPVQYDPHRPPVHGAPPPGYPTYPPGRPYLPPRHMQPPPPGMNHRPAPPPTSVVIDDPLEAFNRMLREKDERDRRARQQRRVTRSRSYSRSRSSSRSFSRSPRSRSRSPIPRNRHRSRSRSPIPRNRRTPRSRTCSFSISRSRSFSRSPSARGSPIRDYSPRRRPPSRYRSPVNTRNSPPRYRYKDRERDRGVTSERDRERDRTTERDRERDRDRSDRERTDRNDRDRDYTYFENNGTAPSADYEYDSNYERNRQRPPLLRNPRYGVPPVPRKDYPQQDNYYPPTELCPTPAYPAHTTRYNARGPPYPPPLMSVKTIPPHGILDRPEAATPHRKYDDIAPPGIEQPPVPGFETTQRYDSRYPPYDRPRDDGPPGVDRYQKSSPYSDREEHRETDRPPRPESNRDYRDNRDKSKNGVQEKDDTFDRKYSASPDRRHKSVSPRRSPRDGAASSQDKSRRRKRDDSSDRDKRVSDTRLDHDKDKKEKKREDEDEKSKKNKEKKKKKEKKEAERKKKKEKKEKKEQEKLKKAEEKKAKEAQDIKKDDVNDLASLELKSISTTSFFSSSKTSMSLLSISSTDIPEFDPTIKVAQKPKLNLYDDILSEEIDNTVVENYGKIDLKKADSPVSPAGRKSPEHIIPQDTEEDSEEKDTSFDGLELHSNESELKTEFVDTSKTKTNEVLAPVPEPSKWEIDDDISTTPEKMHPSESKQELRQVFERPGKGIVTSEVIKRAENAIFAKAINAIRPIEIKKISVDRAKLYSGEKTSTESLTKEPVKNIQITIPGGSWNLDDIPPPGTEPIKLTKTDRSSKTTPPPNRLSVKERLGCKVEELDKITKDKPFEKNRSRTLSPLSRRNDDAIRNAGAGERRVEVDDRRRDDRSRHEPKGRDRNDYEQGAKNRGERSKSRDRSGYRDRRQTNQKEQRKDERGDGRNHRRDDRKTDRRSERSRSRQWNDRRHRDERRKDDRRDTKERDRGTKESTRDRSSRDRERNTRDRERNSRERDISTRDRSSKDRERTGDLNSSRDRNRRDRMPRDRNSKERDRVIKEKERTSRDREREKHKRRSHSRKSKSSRSESSGEREKRKKKTEKKHKKEKEKDKDKEKDKGKKHKKDEESNENKDKIDSKVVDKKRENNESTLTNDKPEKVKLLDDRRKPTLDEANFEPDYDLETESEIDEIVKSKLEACLAKKRERSKSADKKSGQEVIKKRRIEEPDKRSQRESSTSESSDSSTDERHKKKHKKHKKKKYRRDSTSSSSSSDTDSSVDKKSKKRHKSSKKIKKKKKAKHK